MIDGNCVRNARSRASRSLWVSVQYPCAVGTVTTAEYVEPMNSAQLAVQDEYPFHHTMCSGDREYHVSRVCVDGRSVIMEEWSEWSCHRPSRVKWDFSVSRMYAGSYAWP
jgi:hypothetical protein